MVTAYAGIMDKDPLDRISAKILVNAKFVVNCPLKPTIMTIFYFISPFFPESGLSNKNPFA
jgi:hypothetical protein